MADNRYVMVRDERRPGGPTRSMVSIRAESPAAALDGLRRRLHPKGFPERPSRYRVHTAGPDDPDRHRPGPLLLTGTIDPPRAKLRFHELELRSGHAVMQVDIDGCFAGTLAGETIDEPSLYKACARVRELAERAHERPAEPSLASQARQAADPIPSRPARASDSRIRIQGRPRPPRPGRTRTMRAGRLERHAGVRPAFRGRGLQRRDRAALGLLDALPDAGVRPAAPLPRPAPRGADPGHGPAAAADRHALGRRAG